MSTSVLGGLAIGCSDDADDLVPGTYDVERYDLRGEYDWSRGRLAATATITLSTLEPDVTAVVFDSAVEKITAVRAESGDALPFTISEESLTVDISSLSDRGADAKVVLAIDYEAAPGDAFRAVPARDGDPVSAHAVFTLSEPQDARTWMPCHDRPDDRALFSVEMTMDQGERMIANGDLVTDETDGTSKRRMAYATQYPLPTYLMAFAISDFEVASANAGDLPIAVWHRRGVPGEYEALLDELDREIGIYEGLLGPYPFEKYAIVMLPDFSGGIEHAGITFQGESGTGQPSLAGDVSLTAHELGHQWFGDLVTVATWDDLWIKEGMATLLAEQAVRIHEDKDGVGTLSGDAWYVVPGEAIRDTSLAPDDKYTSGPYDRAAWLYGQIRRVVGEDAFWKTLRGVLEDHRFGTVSTDELLAAFEPTLGADAAKRAHQAVDAKDLPSIEVAPSDSGGGVVTLHDPEEILVAPMEIEWHHEDGTTTRQELVPEQPMELRREAHGDFLVLDPSDVHPSFSILLADDKVSTDSFSEDVAPLRLPDIDAQVERFSALAGAHELAALYDGWPTPVASTEFVGFKASLDADSAEAVSIEAACTAAEAETDTQVKDAWAVVLEDALISGPPSMGIGYVGNYSECSALIPPKPLFADEWAELEAGLKTDTLVSEERLSFLSKFVLSPPDALKAWGNTARSAYSLRARALAARELRGYAEKPEDIGQDALPAWRTLINELLVSSEASEVLRQAILAAVPLGGETAAENAEALDALSGILHSPVTRVVHSTAVCAAHELTVEDEAAWEAFVADLEGATLSANVRALLADPDQCS